ncbi:hypothetical protein L195_g021804 [Trifolium pratense]|uniref:Reverse transcriptase domain-containing protein n=1 Tax=Trifolium pratense TaxID=57577 RepID=A0A2K3N6C2_TRIPR|nr:hypothetical protein L195_g021804 [Trifolium pratense]
MPGLSRDLVEHRLPLLPDKKPVKQLPRRFAPEIMSKIKTEIERLSKCKFIKTARYVEWMANIVPVIKKNGTLRVCIDFRDLNNATPKDEYPMPVAEMLIDSATGFEYLSSFEWVVMPFGLKNAGATYQRAMNFIFHDFIDTFMQVYIDDIVVKSSSSDGDFLGFVVHKKGIEISQNKTKAIMEIQPPTNKKQLQSLLGKLKKEDVFKWGPDQQKALDDIKDYLSKPPILMPPIRNKCMKLYISASDLTIGSMLAQEDENGVERAIYYLSRPILHSRIGKWALALTEYSLTYKPLKAVKGQTVADFLVDHSIIEMPQNYVSSEPWKLYFDGSKHKYGTGIEVLIISPLNIPTKFQYKINGFCSNNEAEYEALITGLDFA